MRAVLHYADRPVNGDIIPAEELRKLADGKRLFWDEERKALLLDTKTDDERQREYVIKELQDLIERLKAGEDRCLVYTERRHFKKGCDGLRMFQEPDGGRTILITLNTPYSHPPIEGDL